VLLNIQVFWDVTLCDWWAVPSVWKDHLTLKLKALWSFATSGNTCPTQWSHITEEFRLHNWTIWGCYSGEALAHGTVYVVTLGGWVNIVLNQWPLCSWSTWGLKVQYQFLRAHHGSLYSASWIQPTDAKDGRRQWPRHNKSNSRLMTLSHQLPSVLHIITWFCMYSEHSKWCILRHCAPSQGLHIGHAFLDL
jgi:hypothetical protein